MTEYTPVKDYIKMHEEEMRDPVKTAGMKALTPKEYAKIKRMSVGTVMRRLNDGLIPNAEKPLGRWLIYVPADDAPEPGAYRRVLDENTELKALLAGIARMCQWDKQKDD